MDINNIQNIVEKDGIIFLSYGGFLTQTLIAGMTEALEKETARYELNMGIANNIFTIFIELSQNVMNYSKSKNKDCNQIQSEGLIIVGKDDDMNYYIHSQNVIATADKDKIEPKLDEIMTFTKDEIKKKYRELRKSGRDMHGKGGGGIGFYEIAKRSDEIEYSFKEINEDKFYFHFISKIKTQKDEI